MVDETPVASASHPKTAAWHIGKIATALLLQPHTVAALHSIGITVDPAISAVALPSIVGYILHVIHDKIKSKVGWSWL